MNLKILLSFYVLLGCYAKAQESNYSPVRIYETNTYNYSGALKYDFQIKPLYPHYIEVSGLIKSGKEFIIVEPKTVLKEIVVGIFIPPCGKLCDELQGNGGQSLDGGITDRSSRVVEGVLSLVSTESSLKMISSEVNRKIIRYIVYDNNGNEVMKDFNVPKLQEVEVNISWLPVGIYHVYTVFEDYTYEGKSFQK
ncbi:hypothetical protein UJ101_00686 [Flavobacteriaceae bacterium UJ101]|nr:hypothetical protein UJ101_00686 [Flavobacteriaceae bacterium UJ101]